MIHILRLHTVSLPGGRYRATAILGHHHTPVPPIPTAADGPVLTRAVPVSKRPFIGLYGRFGYHRCDGPRRWPVRQALIASKGRWARKMLGKTWWPRAWRTNTRTSLWRRHRCAAQRTAVSRHNAVHCVGVRTCIGYARAPFFFLVSSPLPGKPPPSPYERPADETARNPSRISLRPPSGIHRDIITNNINTY